MHAHRYPPEGFAFPDGFDPMTSSIRRLFNIHEVTVESGVVRFLRHGHPAVEVHSGLVDDTLPPEWSHVDTDAVRHCVAARWNAIDKIARELDGVDSNAETILQRIGFILDEDCGLLAETGFPIVVRPCPSDSLLARWNLYLQDRPEVGPISVAHLNEDRKGYSTRQGAEDALDEIKEKLAAAARMAEVAPGFEHIISEGETIKYDTLLPIEVKPQRTRAQAALDAFEAGANAHQMAEILRGDVVTDVEFGGAAFDVAAMRADDHNLRDLPGRLRSARATRSLSQKAAAAEIGVAPLTLLRWEAGTSKPGSVTTKTRLLAFLHRAEQKCTEHEGWVPPSVHEEQKRLASQAVDRLWADESLLLAALVRVQETIQGWDWVQDSRGAYSWDDDKYKEETHRCFVAVREILDPAINQSRSRMHLSPPGTPERLRREAQDIVDDLKAGDASRSDILRTLRGFAVEKVDLTPRPQVEVCNHGDLPSSLVRVRWVVLEHREVVIKV